MYLVITLLILDFELIVGYYIYICIKTRIVLQIYQCSWIARSVLTYSERS